jgi:hypothetical protein
VKFAWQVLIHTPIWVFPLFAYLVWLGIKATRPRTVTIWRSLIVPAVFIVWGLSRLLSRQQDVFWPLVTWLAAAAALLLVGLLTARPFELDHTTGEIRRPGKLGAAVPQCHGVRPAIHGRCHWRGRSARRNDCGHRRPRDFRRHDGLFPRQDRRAAAPVLEAAQGRHQG